MRRTDFLLGNEIPGNRVLTGHIYMAAFYWRSAEELIVGEKLLLSNQVLGFGFSSGNLLIANMTT